jgi:hypothetical protein
MSSDRTKIDRTSGGLRDALFDALERLRDGDMEAGDAKAFAALAREIVGTVNLEIEVQKLRLEYPGDAKVMVPSPLPLGRN